MRVLTGRQIVRSVGVALVVTPVFAVAACEAGVGTPTAGSATPSSAPVSPSAAPTRSPADPATNAVAVVRTAPSKARPASSAARALPDGKSQAFVLAVDTTHRVATIRPMKMVSCVGESPCEDDYKIKVIGPVTTVAIASGATFAAAQDGDGTVCDATAPAKACAVNLTHFAAMVKQYQRKADLVIHDGDVVTMNEIFTP